MTERGFLNHIWYKLLDEEGIPVESANVYIYTLNLNLVTIYESDGLTEITQPLVTTSGGVFEFYVKDDIGVPSGAAGHYPWDTQYIVSWSKDDKSGVISNDRLFGAYAQVDEDDSTSTRVNKAISNFIGWTIQDHIDFMFGTTQNCGSSSSSSSSLSSSSKSSSSLSSSSSSLSLSASILWTSYFNEDYWTPTDITFLTTLGTWDAVNSEWDSEYYGDFGDFEVVDLEDVVEPTPWTIGYRPTKIRVSFTDGIFPPSASIGLYDSSSPFANSLLSDGFVGIITEDKQEFDITFAGNDINELIIVDYEGNSFSISDIEFGE